MGWRSDSLCLWLTLGFLLSVLPATASDAAIGNGRVSLGQLASFGIRESTIKLLEKSLPGIKYLYHFTGPCWQLPDDSLRKDELALRAGMHTWPTSPLERLITGHRLYEAGVYAFNSGDLAAATDILASSLHLQLYPHVDAGPMRAWHNSLASSAGAFVGLRSRAGQLLLALAKAEEQLGLQRQDVHAVDLAFMAGDASIAVLSGVAEDAESGPAGMGEEEREAVEAALEDANALLVRLLRTSAEVLVMGDNATLLAALEMRGGLRGNSGENELEAEGSVSMDRLDLVAQLVPLLEGPLTMTGDDDCGPSGSLHIGIDEATLRRRTEERQAASARSALQTAAEVTMLAVHSALQEEVGVSCSSGAGKVLELRRCREGVAAMWSERWRPELGSITGPTSLLATLNLAERALWQLDRVLTGTAIGMAHSSGAVALKIQGFEWRFDRLWGEEEVRHDGVEVPPEGAAAAPPQVCLDFTALQQSLLALNETSLTEVSTTLSGLLASQDRVGGAEVFWSIVGKAMGAKGGAERSTADTGAAAGGLDFLTSSLVKQLAGEAQLFNGLGQLPLMGEDGELLEGNSGDTEEEFHRRRDGWGSASLRWLLSIDDATLSVALVLSCVGAVSLYRSCAQAISSHLRRSKGGKGRAGRPAGGPSAAAIAQRAAAATALREALAAESLPRLTAAVKAAEDVGVEKPLIKKARNVMHAWKKRKVAGLPTGLERRPSTQISRANSTARPARAGAAGVPSAGGAISHTTSGESAAMSMEWGYSDSDHEDEWVTVQPAQHAKPTSPKLASALLADRLPPPPDRPLSAEPPPSRPSVSPSSSSATSSTSNSNGPAAARNASNARPAAAAALAPALVARADSGEHNQPQTPTSAPPCQASPSKSSGDSLVLNSADALQAQQQQQQRSTVPPPASPPSTSYSLTATPSPAPAARLSPLRESSSVAATATTTPAALSGSSKGSSTASLTSLQPASTPTFASFARSQQQQQQGGGLPSTTTAVLPSPARQPSSGAKGPAAAPSGAAMVALPSRDGLYGVEMERAGATAEGKAPPKVVLVKRSTLQRPPPLPMGLGGDGSGAAPAKGKGGAAAAKAAAAAADKNAAAKGGGIKGKKSAVAAADGSGQKGVVEGMMMSAAGCRAPPGLVLDAKARTAKTHKKDAGSGPPGSPLPSSSGAGGEVPSSPLLGVTLPAAATVTFNDFSPSAMSPRRLPAAPATSPMAQHHQQSPPASAAAAGLARHGLANTTRVSNWLAGHEAGLWQPMGPSETPFDALRDATATAAALPASPKKAHSQAPQQWGAVTTASPHSPSAAFSSALGLAPPGPLEGLAGLPRQGLSPGPNMGLQMLSSDGGASLLGGHGHGHLPVMGSGMQQHAAAPAAMLGGSPGLTAAMRARSAPQEELFASLQQIWGAADGWGTAQHAQHAAAAPKSPSSAGKAAGRPASPLLGTEAQWSVLAGLSADSSRSTTEEGVGAGSLAALGFQESND